MATDRRRGAARWAQLLSELAEVDVDVFYERPYWRVAWADGPTAAMLSDRARALADYPPGRALAFDRLLFQHRITPRAFALAWLDHGIDAGTDPIELMGAVERLAEAGPYPERRPAEALAAADVLAALAGGSEYRMGTLLADASPKPATPPAGSPPTVLPGRVTGIAWPGHGPPATLLGHTNTNTEHEDGDAAVVGGEAGCNETPRNPATVPGEPVRPGTCRQCGRPMIVKRTGRPARYCSATCRSRAHRGRATAR